MTFQRTIAIRTRGRGTGEITADVRRAVRDSGVTTGICNVFLQHTSASLILCENADPTVRRDLEMLFARLAPDGDPAYAHSTEGADDMAAHARSVLTTNALALPIAGGELVLGTWQGIYLWEHRTAPHTRQLVVTIVGE